MQGFLVSAGLSVSLVLGPVQSLRNMTPPVDVNLQAVWMMDPKDVSELQHEEFYRYIAQAYDKPRFTLHYKTDAPLNIRSIFYVPEMVRRLAVHSSIALGKPQVQVYLTVPTPRAFPRKSCIDVFATVVQG